MLYKNFNRHDFRWIKAGTFESDHAGHSWLKRGISLESATLLHVPRDGAVLNVVDCFGKPMKPNGPYGRLPNVYDMLRPGLTNMDVEPYDVIIVNWYVAQMIRVYADNMMNLTYIPQSSLQMDLISLDKFYYGADRIYASQWDRKNGEPPVGFMKLNKAVNCLSLPAYADAIASDRHVSLESVYIACSCYCQQDVMQRRQMAHNDYGKNEKALYKLNAYLAKNGFQPFPCSYTPDQLFYPW